MYEYPLPWKAIHPKDSSFNIKSFKISDYQGNNQQLANALNCLFPKGTPKIDVDRVLVGIAGAKIKPHTKKNGDFVVENEYLYEYTFRAIQIFNNFYPVNNNFKILAIKYDKNNRLEYSSFIKYGHCVIGDINAK